MKSKQFKIIFENEDYIIVDKQSGMLSIPDRYDGSITNLYDVLKRSRKEILIVHRLDRDTSGLICFAKNAATHAILSQAFENRIVTKKYLTIVEGRPAKQGKIEQAIETGKGSGSKMRISAKGKPSVTSFKTLETFRHFSLVQVDLQTGRTHQIRVHFSFIGHPVCVDAIYGDGNGIYLSSFKQHYRKKEGRAEQPIMRRLALHAFELTLPEVNGQAEATYSTEMPREFQVFLKVLRKYDALSEN